MRSFPLWLWLYVYASCYETRTILGLLSDEKDFALNSISESRTRCGKRHADEPKRAILAHT